MVCLGLVCVCLAVLQDYLDSTVSKSPLGLSLSSPVLLSDLLSDLFCLLFKLKSNKKKKINLQPQTDVMEGWYVDVIKQREVKTSLLYI